MKRLMCVFLLAGLLTAMVTFLACAEDETVIKIQTPEDFMAFLNQAAATPSISAVLTCDIDMRDAIGLKPAALLNGTLDGAGHQILNLNMDAENDVSALFLEIGDTGRVQNLTIGGVFSGKNAAAVAIVNRGVIADTVNHADIYIAGRGGGIACENRGEITGCANKGNIFVLDSAIGAGISCDNYGVISGSTNHALIDGSFAMPYPEVIAGICANSYDNSTVENCINLGSIDCGNRGGGLVGYAYNAYLLNLTNFGDVVTVQSLVAGIVCNAEDGLVENCRNYGLIVSSDRDAAGIAANGTATLRSCINYGDIHAYTYQAGIAARWDGVIDGCVNYGLVSGENHTAGISALFSGTITRCENHGRIENQFNYVGGIVGDIMQGSIERCTNTAVVAGGQNLWYLENGIGGIVGYCSGSITISDVVNTGLVESPKGAAGSIAGHFKGSLQNAVTLCNTPLSICTREENTITCLYGTHYDGIAIYDPSILYSGELAWLLNTNDGTSANSGIWSQKGDYPILANSQNQPTRRVVCSYDFGEMVLYTESDGKVQPPPAYMLYDYTCVDDNGNSISSDDLFREDNLFSTESVVHVENAWDLNSALTNYSVQQIVLDSSIIVDRDLYLKQNQKIIGQGHQLIMGSYVLESSANASISDLSITGETSSIRIKSGTLSVEGMLQISSPVELCGGSLNLTNGKIYNPKEISGVPSMRIGANGTGGEYAGYTKTGNDYFAAVMQKSTASLQIVAPASSNRTLAYDIYPEIREGAICFFLPCTADASNITVCKVDEDGVVTETYASLDLSGNREVYLPLWGKSYPVRALQSSLPTLAFTIDENFGTIEAMNTSPDHSVFCYGSVRMDVTPQLHNTKRWSSFVSTENDPAVNGSMKIRGRGNSTWSSILDAKKPYQFKLEKKVDVLGMGEHKTWILLMNDEHLVRNKLGLDLAQDIGLTNSSLGEFVDVFMNGRYLGNYLLCERVEISKERVNIAKLDDEYKLKGNSTFGLDLTGGYLLEIDQGAEALRVRHEESDTNVSIKEPEDLAREATPYNAYGYIYNYVMDFLDAVYGDGVMKDGQSFMEYIDQESFARYFFHQEFLMNNDCGRGSTFFYKDRDSIDPLLHAGPVWDHDLILEDDPTHWVLPTTTRIDTGNRAIYNQLSYRKEFVEMLIYYYENSDIPKVLANASKHIDTYTELLAESAKMNSIRWSLPEFDIEWLRDAMDIRAQWIANNYKTLLDIAE